MLILNGENSYYPDGLEGRCEGDASAVLSACRAIMKYHQAKMDEINEYIRDLWLKIYKGSGEHRHVLYTPLHCIYHTPLFLSLPPPPPPFQTLTVLRSGQRMTQRKPNCASEGPTSTG